MKPVTCASLLVAVLLHALVLFGFKMETPARPLAVSDQPSAIEVALVQAPPEPPTPAATPEPTPESTLPKPTPIPEATPEIPTPPPESESEPLGTPQPKPAPRHIQHRRTPHTAPGAASEISVASSRGAPNGPLSTQASYLSNPRPEYPDQAREMRQQGIVILDVEVGIDGRPDDVELSRGSGYSLLDRAALEAVRRWRFAPAEAAGLPIPTRVQVPVRFTLSQ